MTEKQIERFWSKVDKSSDCWEWTGYRNCKGYGCIMRNRKLFYTHRLAYFLQYGVDPRYICVCHHCDNPPCVKGDHLFLGTINDNTQDAAKKGRMRPGILNHNAKLSNDLVRYIRQSRLLQRDIGEKLGVAQSLVSMVQNHKIWKHVK